jgi:repressor LexA
MPALTNAIANDLTELEARVLDYLARVMRPGFCPSREEISRAAGLGGRGYHVNNVLKDLDEREYIRLEPGRSRAITLLKTADSRPFRFETRWVPLVGRIGASPLRETAVQVDNPYADEAIELARGLVPGHDSIFALRVSGDSLLHALVTDGDIVVLDGNAEILNGDMVAAEVTGDDGKTATTLKKFYLENGYVRLRAANPQIALDPILLYRPEQVKVYGKAVLIIRQVGEEWRRA